MADQSFDAEACVDAATALMPVVTGPLRKPGALPIGVQIIAAPWREADALRAAAALERDGVTCAALSAQA